MDAQSHFKHSTVTVALVREGAAHDDFICHDHLQIHRGGAKRVLEIQLKFIDAADRCVEERAVEGIADVGHDVVEGNRHVFCFVHASGLDCREDNVGLDAR